MLYSRMESLQILAFKRVAEMGNQKRFPSNAVNTAEYHTNIF
jgi:hypothetical protein